MKPLLLIILYTASDKLNRLLGHYCAAYKGAKCSCHYQFLQSYRLIHISVKRLRLFKFYIFCMFQPKMFKIIKSFHSKGSIRGTHQSNRFPYTYHALQHPQSFYRVSFDQTVFLSDNLLVS